MRRLTEIIPAFIFLALSSSGFAQSYPIVDTDVSTYYSDISEITAPSQGEPYYGQDAHYTGNQPSYTDNGDGTITDLVSGLMWEKDMGEKISFEEALPKAEASVLGGHSDWRVPSIKELYSLILFTGQVKGEAAISFFIDTAFFIQPLGDTSIGEREIDAQTWSSTEYVGQTMAGDETVFGVNFIDGRIKGYPKYKKATGAANTMYFRMVRGNTAYGKNNFVDNEDGTITDFATGLMWQTADDGIARDWEEALAYAEGLELADKTDWRLPNAKELQSIVDYSRSPQTSSSPAIDPLFGTTEINDPDGNPGQYPYFWTSTTHLDGANPYASAAYIAFGEGQGEMNGILMDVHGAGCQRSDPKSGEMNDYPEFWGPQGDVRYVYNYVRSVRDASTTSSVEKKSGIKLRMYPNPVKKLMNIRSDQNLSSITIYNLSGQVLMKQVVIQNRTTINIASLPDGVYIINILSDKGESIYGHFNKIH